MTLNPVLPGKPVKPSLKPGSKPPFSPKFPFLFFFLHVPDPLILFQFYRLHILLQQNRNPLFHCLTFTCFFTPLLILRLQIMILSFLSGEVCKFQTSCLLLMSSTYTQALKILLLFLHYRMTSLAL